MASRRAAEQIILAGRVTINGAVVSQLGTKVHPVRDRVEVDGQWLRPRRKLYVALHKPRGYLCTRYDPEKRRTVADLLPQEWRHLYPVGRLDNDSEGLLFLTNDGEFALRLTHPRYRTRKVYQVIVPQRFDPTLLPRLLQGIQDAGDLLKAEKARILNANNSRSTLELELAEGKNRAIRRMFAALGLPIQSLKRTRIGPIRLGELPPGRWRTLTETEINSLLQSL